MKSDWSLEILNCRNHATSAIAGTIEFDVGIHNAKQAELEDLAGAEIGKKVLAAVTGGKLDALNAVPAAPPPAAAAADTAPATKAAGPSPDSTRVAPSVAGSTQSAVPLSLADAQRRLIDLGYLSGKPDGVWGKKSSDALRVFQQKNRLDATGTLDEGTNSALRGAGRAAK